MFPESSRVIYGHNPLTEVICQLQFPTILRIREKNLADFQDKIRKDYPIYQLKEPSIEFPQLPKELATIFSNVTLPSPGPITHRFLTPNLERFVTLAEEFLALAEKKYERWETFRAELVKIEAALKEVYQPSFYSRVGLRYRDVISRKKLHLENISWQDLLQPYMVAELADERVCKSILRLQVRTVMKIPEIENGQIVLIHGLIKEPGSDEEAFLIDADFSAERKEGLGEPFQFLDKFNRSAGRLFRWAIKEKLHHAMGPRDI